MDKEIYLDVMFGPLTPAQADDLRHVLEGIAVLMGTQMIGGTVQEEEDGTEDEEDQG